MPARTILLGASGYTGALTVEAMARRGMTPLLAGRDEKKLDAIRAAHLPSARVAVADLTRAATVSELLEAGDVLVSTVGPFGKLGAPAAEAAIGRRGHYLDSNGEPDFTRTVFERLDPAARAAGVAMLTAFGWESVLGNLAGALALRDAGQDAVRVDTGYFYVGTTSFSSGTRASFADAMVKPSFAFRGGVIRTVRGGERYRTFAVEGRRRPGISLGASEHFALPRTFPQLREVNAYQGWFGRLSPRVARLLHVLAPIGSALATVPGALAIHTAAQRRWLHGSSGGPTAAERRRGGVHVVGIAYDADGGPLAEVHLTGAEGYEFTAAILAWGAERVIAGATCGAGALGPVEAFGIEELERGCREAGVARVADG